MGIPMPPKSTTILFAVLACANFTLCGDNLY